MNEIAGIQKPKCEPIERRMLPFFVLGVEESTAVKENLFDIGSLKLMENLLAVDIYVLLTKCLWLIIRWL